MANNVGYMINDEELTALMKEMDSDNDGKIDFQEFIAHNVSYPLLSIFSYAQPELRNVPLNCMCGGCTIITFISYLTKCHYIYSKSH